MIALICRCYDWSSDRHEKNKQDFIASVCFVWCIWNLAIEDYFGSGVVSYGRGARISRRAAGFGVSDSGGGGSGVPVFTLPQRVAFGAPESDGELAEIPTGGRLAAFVRGRRVVVSQGETFDERTAVLTCQGQ